MWLDLYLGSIVNVSCMLSSLETQKSEVTDLLPSTEGIMECIYIHVTACLFPQTIGFYLKSLVFVRELKDLIKKLETEIYRN